MFFASPKKKKSLLSVLLAFTIVFNLCFALLDTSSKAVNQSEINALKKQQEQLAEKKAGIQAQADAINSKVNAQTEKLEILNAKLEVTNSELENLSEQITIYTNSIAKMENDLNIANQKEQELLETYKTRMRAMEENGTVSYISIIFQANSFTDLLSRIEFVNEIMEYDNGLVNNVRDAKEKTQNAKAEMEAEMADQEIVFASYQEKQADLVAQQTEVNAVLSSLKADAADYQKQLDSVKTLQSSISGQISDMQNKLAEQERIRAEQAAANQISSGNGNWYSDSEGTGSGQDIVDFAMEFLGVPYVYGGTSPSGFDCSGLVYYCYRHFGYSINRTATAQSYNGKVVSSSDLQPGDIVFFTEQYSSYIGHCGLYIGGGQFVHAPHTGDVVKISSLASGYYADHYWGARRIVS